ncbi:MAG: outer membrane protein TolC [Verrucomicrobiales bacterium]|jgi:outer membrane protein TolC
MKAIRILTFFTTALGLTSVLAGEGQSDPHRIDLSTALKLADADNTQIALARERVNQAEAQLAQARTLILPDLAAGVSYAHHDGRLQETNGNILDVERSSGFAGLGSGAVGAGDVQVSGIGLNLDLGDALYAPLVARQQLLAVEAESEAVKNQMLLAVAAAYFELVRAQGNLEIAKEALANAEDLAKTTNNFAETGEGLASDSERAKVEVLIRQRDIAAANELVAIRAVELARLLRLKTGTQLRATSSPDARVNWVDASSDPETLTTDALTNRPELKIGDAKLRASEQSLKRAKLAPLLPKLSFGASTGGFGGGEGNTISNSGNRTDVSVGIYWTLDGLGLGQRARTEEMESLREQARLIRIDIEDGITAEVTASLAAVQNRVSQISSGSKAVAGARKSYELNRSRVFENQGLPIETLQAIQSLAVARSLHRDAIVDYNIAQFQLFTAIGQPAE